MISAFILGLAGSLHCVGMCGPLMVSFKVNQSRRSFITYHLGRLLVYGLLGLLFGLIGQGLQILNTQRYIAIITGAVLIILYTVPAIRKWIEMTYYKSKAFSTVRTLMQKQFGSGQKWWIAGMLNGLLPCGLIYMALAGSLILANSITSVGFMLIFGIGTLPALILVGFFERLIPNGLKKRFSMLYTILAVVAGGVLLFRGLMDYPTFDEFLQMSINQMITICGI